MLRKQKKSIANQPHDFQYRLAQAKHGYRLRTTLLSAFYKITMRRHPKKQHWTRAQTQTLRQYVAQHRQQLRSKFYQNIAAGKIRFRKAKGFFIQMGARLGKSSEKCKSKFQKMETDIYQGLLGIPEPHYRLYCHLRAGHRLASSRLRQVPPAKACTCVRMHSGNGAELPATEKASSTRTAEMQTRLENLRIKIILKCRSGELGPVDLGTSKLGTTRRAGVCNLQKPTPNLPALSQPYVSGTRPKRLTRGTRRALIAVPAASPTEPNRIQHSTGTPSTRPARESSRTAGPGGPEKLRAA